MTCALNMKPVSYQNIVLSMDGRPQMTTVNGVHSTSHMLYCDKCGFSTADIALFRRHMIEHNGTKFHCPRCPKISFTEAEFCTHVMEHSKFPYRCPHCGQSYMRRLCFLKHIDRVHVRNKDPSKPGLKIIRPAPVSSVSAATSQPRRMVITRGLKNVSPPTVPSAVCVNGRKDAPRTLEINLQNGKKITEACTSSLNVNSPSNMALTVALPEEVTIPAGCKVELVEVKTVNGSKELKLRLVSKQAHNPVVNAAKTRIAPKPPVVKVAHSNEPINLSAVDRTLPASSGNAAYPALVKVNIPKILTSQVGRGKVAQKRKGQESMDLKWHQYLPKSSKLTVDSGSDHNVGAAASQMLCSEGNTSDPSPPLDFSCLRNLLNRTTQRTCPDGVFINLVGSDSDNPEKETKAPGVKVEPTQSHSKSDASLTMRAAVPNPSSLNVPSPKTPAAVPHSQERMAPRPQPCPARKKPKTQPLILKRKQILTEKQDLSQEPEGFPVISSVFSLSQEPQGDQDSIQPLMMALRGIIMDKPPVKNDVKNIEAMSHSALVPSKSNPVQKETIDHVKVEADEEKIKVGSLTTVLVKEEKLSTVDKSTDIPDLCPPKEEPPPATNSPVKSVCNSNASKTHPCLSKYVTVSLTRIDDAPLERTSSVPKLKAATRKTRTLSLGDCTVLYTTPLKGDQLVTRPGPNQPVVVLNHPKPRAPLPDLAVPSLDPGEQMPRCQILKMKLSKVIGQKYEVMGCTVRVSP